MATVGDAASRTYPVGAPAYHGRTWSLYVGGTRTTSGGVPPPSAARRGTTATPCHVVHEPVVGVASNATRGVGPRSNDGRPVDGPAAVATGQSIARGVARRAPSRLGSRRVSSTGRRAVPYRGGVRGPGRRVCRGTSRASRPVPTPCSGLGAAGTTGPAFHGVPSGPTLSRAATVFRGAALRGSGVARGPFTESTVTSATSDPLATGLRGRSTATITTPAPSSITMLGPETPGEIHA